MDFVEKCVPRDLYLVYELNCRIQNFNFISKLMLAELGRLSIIEEMLPKFRG